MMNLIKRRTSPAFTIVELIIVIVVLGILAGIVVAGFGSWQTSIAKKAVQSDLRMAAAAMENAKNFSSGYPSSIPSSFKASSNVTVTYFGGSNSDYCIDAVYASKPEVHYYIDSFKGSAPRFGTCAMGDEDENSPGSGTSPAEYIASTKVAKTSTHVCVVASGQVYCWGQNSRGQLGDGTTTDRTDPVLVGGALAGKTVSSISAADGDYGAFTCAIAGGQLYCWGNNNEGQLGDGTTTNRSSPVPVSGALAGKTVVQVQTTGVNEASNSAYACARTRTGEAYCWGQNWGGQLGNSQKLRDLPENSGQCGACFTTEVPTPTLVGGALAGKSVSFITNRAWGSTSGYWQAGKTYAVADGQLYSWGPDNQGGSSSPNPTLVGGTALNGKTVSKVAKTSTHVCVVASGQVYCWGQNSRGQLGDGTTTDRTDPVLVGGALAGKTVSSISAADGGYGAFTCAIASGQLYCWGNNDESELGDGTNTTRNAPTLVGGDLTGKTVVQVQTTGVYEGSNSAYTCALTDEGKAYCWGQNWGGQLGNSQKLRDLPENSGQCGACFTTEVPTPTLVGGALAGKSVSFITNRAWGSTSGYWQAGKTYAVADGQLYSWGPDNQGGSSSPNPTLVGGTALNGKVIGQ